MVAIGEKLLSIPPTETFHEFLIGLLFLTIGQPWFENEIKKPEPEQHVIIKWHRAYLAWKREHATEQNEVEGGWVAPPSGEVWSLLTLAYDCYCLAHHQCSNEKLMGRLLDWNMFQGARYEVAVAATFIRAGYEVEYINDMSKKACEFIASDENTRERIGVEAKSRHRPGILHTEGTAQDIEEVKVGISRLLNEAICQKPGDCPFTIFIDINLPNVSSSTIEDKMWFSDLKQAISNLHEIDEKNPEEFAALFITNYSYHYGISVAIDTSRYSEDQMLIIPKYTEFSILNSEALSRVSKAVNEYGRVPHDW